MASGGNDIKFIAACLLIGGGLFHSALKRHRKLRQVVDTPRSKIDTAAQGYVEFEGFAWPAGGTVQSYENGEAVYYCFELQREYSTGSGKNRRTEWRTVSTFSHKEPFYVVDSTGVAVIDPLQGEINIGETRIRSWNSIDAKDKERILASVIDGPVDSFPPSTTLWGLFASKFRVKESELRVGSPVYVSGDFRTVEQSAASITSGGLTAFTKKVFCGTNRNIKEATAALDTNRDGTVSAEEAKTGYAMAARIARMNGKTDAEESFAVFGRLGSSVSHQLFVADAFESHLVGRMKSKLWLQFAGGALLLAIGIGIPVYEYFPNVTSDSWATEGPAQTSLPARQVAALNPTQLHTDCVGGTAAACETLLRQSEFTLTLEQSEYYKKVSCAHGNRNRCR